MSDTGLGTNYTEDTGLGTDDYGYERRGNTRHRPDTHSSGVLNEQTGLLNDSLVHS